MAVGTKLRSGLYGVVPDNKLTKIDSCCPARNLPKNPFGVLLSLSPALILPFPAWYKA
jgi:hypothetical protein